MELLCLHCREISQLLGDEQDMLCCPNCKDPGTPGLIDDMVTVSLTKQELRVLTIWAANWAEAIKDTPGIGSDPVVVVQGICDGLTRYTDVPLTMRQELADLRSHFGDVKMFKRGEEVDP